MCRWAKGRHRAQWLPSCVGDGTRGEQSDTLMGVSALATWCRSRVHLRFAASQGNRTNLALERITIYKAYALLALTTLFWAGNSIAGKWAVGHASPMMLVTLRWASVMIALFIFKREQIAADWAAIRPRLGYL